MGSLLKYVGITWAVLGILAILYGILKLTPDLVMSFGMALAPYTQGFDPTSFRLATYATIIFVSVWAYVIPGLLMAGVGTLIRLQQHQ